MPGDLCDNKHSTASPSIDHELYYYPMVLCPPLVHCHTCAGPIATDGNGSHQSDLVNILQGIHGLLSDIHGKLLGLDLTMSVIEGGLFDAENMLAEVLTPSAYN